MLPNLFGSQAGIISAAAAGAPAADLLTGLQGAWDFDGDYNYGSAEQVAGPDTGATALRWDTAGSPIPDAPGSPGEAIDLSGNEYLVYDSGAISDADAKDEFVPQNGQTLSLWFRAKFTDRRDGFHCLFGCGNYTANGLHIFHNDEASGTPARIYVLGKLDNSTDAYLVMPNNSFMDDTWYGVGFSYNLSNGEAKLYLTGQTMIESTWADHPRYPNFRFSRFGPCISAIGVNNAGEVWGGFHIAQFAYWHRALGETEFLALDNGGAGLVSSAWTSG